MCFFKTCSMKYPSIPGVLCLTFLIIVYENPSFFYVRRKVLCYKQNNFIKSNYIFVQGNVPISNISYTGSIRGGEVLISETTCN